LPTPGPAYRQTQGPRRYRPLDPGHRLAAARRPHRTLPRPRTGLLRQPRPSRPPQAQPRPPTRSPRLQSHPGTRRMTTSPTSPDLPISAHLPTIAIDLPDRRPAIELAYRLLAGCRLDRPDAERSH